MASIIGDLAKGLAKSAISKRLDDSEKDNTDKPSTTSQSGGLAAVTNKTKASQPFEPLQRAIAEAAGVKFKGLGATGPDSSGKFISRQQVDSTIKNSPFTAILKRLTDVEEKVSLVDARLSASVTSILADLSQTNRMLAGLQKTLVGQLDLQKKMYEAQQIKEHEEEEKDQKPGMLGKGVDRIKEAASGILGSILTTMFALLVPFLAKRFGSISGAGIASATLGRDITRITNLGKEKLQGGVKSAEEELRNAKLQKEAAEVQKARALREKEVAQIDKETALQRGKDAKKAEARYQKLAQAGKPGTAVRQLVAEPGVAGQRIERAAAGEQVATATRKEAAAVKKIGTAERVSAAATKRIAAAGPLIKKAQKALTLFEPILNFIKKYGTKLKVVGWILTLIDPLYSGLKAIAAENMSDEAVRTSFGASREDLWKKFRRDLVRVGGALVVTLAVDSALALIPFIGPVLALVASLTGITTDLGLYIGEKLAEIVCDDKDVLTVTKEIYEDAKKRAASTVKKVASSAVNAAKAAGGTVMGWFSSKKTADASKAAGPGVAPATPVAAAAKPAAMGKGGKFAGGGASGSWNMPSKPTATGKPGKEAAAASAGGYADLRRQFNELGITDVFTQNALLANINKESGFKLHSEDIAGWGRTANDRIRKYFGSRVSKYSDSELDEIKKDPVRFAETVYGYETKIGRGMGNDKPGDGYKYIGRGYIQITGKNNYAAIGKKIGVDLVNNPELVNDPKYAAKATAAFINMAMGGQLSKGFSSQAEANRAVTQAIGGPTLNLDKGAGAELLAKVNNFDPGASPGGGGEASGGKGGKGAQMLASTGSKAPPPAPSRGGAAASGGGAMSSGASGSGASSGVSSPMMASTPTSPKASPGTQYGIPSPNAPHSPEDSLAAHFNVNEPYHGAAGLPG